MGIETMTFCVTVVSRMKLEMNRSLIFFSQEGLQQHSEHQPADSNPLHETNNKESQFPVIGFKLI